VADDVAPTMWRRRCGADDSSVWRDGRRWRDGTAQVTGRLPRAAVAAAPDKCRHLTTVSPTARRGSGSAPSCRLRPSRRTDESSAPHFGSTFRHHISARASRFPALNIRTAFGATAAPPSQSPSSRDRDASSRRRSPVPRSARAPSREIHPATQHRARVPHSGEAAPRDRVSFRGSR